MRPNYLYSYKQRLQLFTDEDLSGDSWLLQRMANHWYHCQTNPNWWVLLTFIASAIDVAPASIIPMPDKSKLVRVFLTLIASEIDLSPASLIPLPDKSKLVRISLALIASAIDVAPASITPYLEKPKWVRVLIASAMDIAPASPILLPDKKPN